MNQLEISVNKRFSSRIAIAKSIESIERYARLRRIMEIAAIISLSPFIISVVIIVSCVSFLVFKKRIFFTQTRIGYRAKRFEIYKFRTMDGSSSDNGSIKISKYGMFLRKHKIDEIPQFLNVLKGEMSIVGPRPETVEQFDFFVSNINGYELRKTVPCGITGAAQVSIPHSDSIDENRKKLDSDIKYINSISLWVDLKIIFKTIICMITGSQR